MNPRNHPTYSDGEQLTLSQVSADPMLYTITTQTVIHQRFPNPFNIYQAAIRPQYNISPDFCDYTEVSPTDMTQDWAMLQLQSSTDNLNQSLVDSSREECSQHSFAHETSQLPDSKSSMGMSSVTEEGDDNLEPTWRRDEMSDPRKERRRIQNRIAQRTFRARKDDSIKESSARVEALRKELLEIQNARDILFDEVIALQAEIVQLREENGNSRIEGRRSGDYVPWGAADRE